MIKTALKFIFLFGLIALILESAFFSQSDESLEFGNHDHNTSSRPIGFAESVAQSEYVRSHSFQLETRTWPPSYFASVQVRLGTSGQKVNVLSAQLIQKDTGCGWRSSPAKVVEDLDYLELFSRGPCSFSNENSFELTLRLEDNQSLAFFAFSKPTIHSRLPLMKVESFYLDLIWDLNDHVLKNDYPKTSNADLLAWLWNFKESKNHFFYLIAMGIFLFAAGASGLYFLQFATKKIFFSKFILSFGATIAGLCILYTLIIPPFLGPDEANHFLTYAQLNQRSDLMSDSLKAAKKCQYQRVLCHINEKISVLDMDAPEAGGWPQGVGVVELDRRSPLTKVLWSVIGGVLRNVVGATQTLLDLRLINSLILVSLLFCAMLANQFAKTTRNTDDAILQYTVCSLLLPVTIWHYATYFSNYTFIIGPALAIIVMLTFLFRKIQTPLWWELVFALMCAVCGAGGRVGLAFVGAVVAWLFFRAWLTSLCAVEFRNFKSRILGFLREVRLIALIGLLFIVVYWFLSLNVESYSFTILFPVGVVKRSIILIGILAVVALLTLHPRIQNSFATCFRKIGGDRLVRVLSLLLSLAALALLFLPVFRDVGSLGSIEGIPNRLPSNIYAKRVLKNFFGNIGLGGNDFLLIHSFFGGFSCPEPTMSNWFVQIAKLPLVGFLVCALTGTLKANRKTNDTKLLGFGALVIGIFLLYMLALGVASGDPQFNLHGRYLIAFYLFVQTLLFVAYGMNFSNLTRRRVAKCLYLLGVFSHVAAMCSLLFRYF